MHVCKFYHIYPTDCLHLVPLLCMNGFWQTLASVSTVKKYTFYHAEQLLCMKYRLNPQSKVAKLTIADIVDELHGHNILPLDRVLWQMIVVHIHMPKLLYIHFMFSVIIPICMSVFSSYFQQKCLTNLSFAALFTCLRFPDAKIVVTRGEY